MFVLTLIALELSDRCCALCRSEGRRGQPLNVDHIKNRRENPQLAVTLSNTQILCDPCNAGKGNWRQEDYRSIDYARLA